MRLLCKGSDIALLRVLALATPRWVNPTELATEAADWTIGESVYTRLQRSYVISGLHSTLKSLVTAGVVEARWDTTNTRIRFCRLSDDVTRQQLRSLTGGVDPLDITQEEVHEMEDGDRPLIEYHPEAYLKARTPELKRERALKQCPSPWAYAERLQTLQQPPKQA